jgi:23S rRNA (cytidine2498-2'-O)-methyltransferase
MMESQFLFFITNIGNESLLKEEIKLKHPQLNPSYMRKGFMTFKNTGKIFKLQDLAQMQFAFARIWGECLGKNEKFPDANFEHSLSETEIWYGITPKDFKQEEFDKLTMPIESPSRAYMKIKEVVTYFELDLKQINAALELGSAPGGASLYLLEQGLKVYGVDPAEMHEICLQDSNFTHIKKPIQYLMGEDFYHADINLVLVDMNLSPDQSIKETLRVCTPLKETLHTLILTVKITKPSFISKIPDYIMWLKKFGFKNVHYAQMPCHKQEFVLVGLNK